MSNDTFDAEKWLDAVAPTIGIPIDPAWRASVITHLTIVQKASELFVDWPFGTADEPAPVFTA
jgi:hypothetical protein